ncbi:hypothetical protein [Sphingomonas sp.]|jgi:glycosyltransferase involved in cell wall biosynthesis|uniref:hypothetical protein n=1 Tax=Sphingomonas sp. TaxID=28214 RepID=UPI002E323594|nr:hypothetical protein [Sphingomonas sp.]HEX4695917.1 hypothetical protein [Sphingomonas sp.]
MNILLVSGTHPRTPHISGVRAGRFAEELARLGHRCVLLCPTVPGEAEQIDSIADHDWSMPYIAAVTDPAPPVTAGAFARLGTAIRLLRHGGNRVGLYRAMLTRWRHLAPGFPVDAVWTTFGSLESVFVARRIARGASAPWLLDVKDNPDIYVPRLLRRALAWRLRGFGALQSNAELHADAATRWLGQPAELVYSGVDSCFFPKAPPPPRRYVTLVGALYHRHLLDAFVDGVAAFNRNAASPIEIVHLGAQIAMLEESATRHDGHVPVSSPGYVAPAQMAAICQSALANCYVFFGWGFHHKLFELLACRRPVIAYGGELRESLSAAERLHAPLLTPDSPALLRAALEEIDTPGYAIDPRLPPRFFTWPEQAAMVDAAMRRMTA